MVLTIKNYEQTQTIIQSSTTPLASTGLPAIMFTSDDFSYLPKPIYTSNRAFQREGNFQHYSGRDDAEITFTIVFSGPDRYTNFRKIEDLKAPIYLNADEITDDSLALYTGNYTLSFKKPRDYVDKQILEVPLRLITYNNI